MMGKYEKSMEDLHHTLLALPGKYGIFSWLLWYKICNGRICHPNYWHLYRIPKGVSFGDKSGSS